MSGMSLSINLLLFPTDVYADTAPYSFIQDYCFLDELQRSSNKRTMRVYSPEIVTLSSQPLYVSGLRATWAGTEQISQDRLSPREQEVLKP